MDGNREIGGQFSIFCLLSFFWIGTTLETFSLSGNIPETNEEENLSLERYQRIKISLQKDEVIRHIWPKWWPVEDDQLSYFNWLPFWTELN